MLSRAAYFVFLNNDSAENLYVSGGLQDDIFNVVTVRSGSTIDMDGLGGNDRYFISNSGTTQTIRGGVRIVGGSGGDDSITIDDHNDTVGRTTHIDASAVNGQAGDDLFGAGGYLQYSSITGTLTLKCGSGIDTVYAVPNPLTTFNLELGANGALKGGDFLGFGFADALNPRFTDGGEGAGTYSFDNASPISYSGVEDTQIDDTPPAVVSAEFLLDGPAQQIDYVFSEDVSGALNAGAMEIINIDTLEQVPAETIAVTYDSDTNTAHFTFPGYSNGVLPDGDYHARILPGLADLFGNALPSDDGIDFFTLAGDANHDRAVDITDLGILATNWQATGKLFSEGDFNYDGTVDITDLGMLATNWQINLPAIGSRRAANPRNNRTWNHAVASVDLRQQLALLT